MPAETTGDGVPLSEPVDLELERARQFLDKLFAYPYVAFVITPEGVKFYSKADINEAQLWEISQAIGLLIKEV